MPVYVNCPHCDHPQVVRAGRRGKVLFCRQCGWVYKTFKRLDTVRSLPICSMSELVNHQLAGRQSVERALVIAG